MRRLKPGCVPQLPFKRSVRGQHLRRLMGPGAASDGISGTRIQGSPTPVRESDVCRKPDMTACYPTEISLDDWHTMLAYLHLPEHLKTVKDDSRDRLSSEHPARSKTKPAQAVVVRGAEIVVVPELDACEFNPPSHRFTWLEDWHRAEFRFRLCVSDGPADRAVNGRVAFYAESVLIGEVPTSVYITEGHSAPEAGRVGSTSARPYDNVFVSYSHLDEWIAKRLSAALRTLGMEMLRDVDALRSGEEWNARLLELIDKADIFQLYWSNNAKQSPHVEKEWRWTLAAQRSNFIRPVYWERPVPDIPDELKHIHFSFYEMV